MINVSEEIKDLFKDGESHAYSMTIEVGTSMYFAEAESTITDANIKAESAVLKDSLFSGETIKFGAIQTAQFTCNLIGVETNLKGKYIRVKITYDADAEEPTYIPYGEFYVESFEKVAYSYERKLVAYDYSYFLKVKAKQAIASSYTAQNAIDLCEEIFDAFYLHYMPFTSDKDFNFTKMLPDSTTYANILEWMGELYCGWWHVNRYGVFVFVQITPSNTAEQINNLRPKTCEHEASTMSNFSGILFNGFFTLTETKSQEYIYGTATNLYEMYSENPFLVRASASMLDEAGLDILTAVNAILYVPNKIRFEGRPYLEVGDMYRFITDDDTTIQMTIVAPIIQLTISGIGALQETIQAVGVSNNERISTLSKTIYDTSNQASSNTEQMDLNKDGFYVRANKKLITIGDNQNLKVLDVTMVAATYTSCKIDIEVDLESEALTSSETVAVDVEEEKFAMSNLASVLNSILTKLYVTYVWNNEEQELHPQETYIDGKHVLHLMYVVTMTANIRSHFIVFLKAINGTITIPVRHLNFHASGLGLVGDGVWDGTLDIEDDAIRWDITEPTFKADNETISVDTQVPTGDTLSDTAREWDIAESLFDSADEFMRMLVRYIAADRVLEDMETKRALEEEVAGEITYRATEEESG